MASGKGNELEVLNASTAGRIAAINRQKATALLEFNARLAKLSASVQIIVISNLSQAVIDLIKALEEIKTTATLQDLNTGIKVMSTILSAPSVSPTCSTDPFAEKENKTSDNPTTEPDHKAALKSLAKELEIKGATWGKVLGVVLIIAGIILGIAGGLAVIIASLGLSAVAVPVAVKSALAVGSFFCSSIGAGLEWGFADASTDASIAVENVAKVICG
jgi:hypothetical protein